MKEDFMEEEDWMQKTNMRKSHHFNDHEYDHDMIQKIYPQDIDFEVEILMTGHTLMKSYSYENYYLPFIKFMLFGKKP